VHQTVGDDSFTLGDQVSGMGASFVAIGKKAAPVKLRLFNEAQQLVVIFFCFAGVPDDEVTAERCVWLTFADIGYAVEESLTITPATHLSQ
jgi:hypothetical protein